MARIAVYPASQSCDSQHSPQHALSFPKASWTVAVGPRSPNPSLGVGRHHLVRAATAHLRMIAPTLDTIRHTNPKENHISQPIYAKGTQINRSQFMCIHLHINGVTNGVFGLENEAFRGDPRALRSASEHANPPHMSCLFLLTVFHPNEIVVVDG